MYIHNIQYTMNTTQLLTDIENNIGKIYLISNRTHGYYTILPLVEANFLFFLEELYSDIEVDDYEISYKYLIEATLTNKIISYLHNIFNSTTLTFTINNKMNTSNDFFINLNQLLVNHILNNELLKNFKLLEQDITQYEKQNINTLLKNNDEKHKNNICWDIHKQYHKSSRLQDNIIEPNNECKQNTIGKEVIDKETIIPYNDYEPFDINTQDNTEDNIFSSIDNKILSIQYSPLKADEFNTNSDNFNKCAILYCVSQSIGIVIENQNIIFIEYLTKNFKDFELVKTYSKLEKKELDNIKNYFHKRNFESNDTILKKINSFEFLFDINNNKKNDIVNNEIERFIRERYKLDNDPKNMIKANEILGQLILELQYFSKDKIKLTKELSNILLNMGFKKKRMADGIYYCGIISKPNPFLSSGNIEEMFQKTVAEHKLQSLSEIMETLKINSANLQSSSI